MFTENVLHSKKYMKLVFNKSTREGKHEDVFRHTDLHIDYAKKPK